MKNIVLFLVLAVSFALNAMQSESAAENFRDACRVNYVYSKSLLGETRQQHCEKNQEQIRPCIAQRVETILVLGPAPGYDLPIEFSSRCESLIFLGGGMGEFENEWEKHEKVSSNKWPTRLYKTVDLTGGFYDLMASQKMASILFKIFKNFLDTGKLDYSEMERYLEANLSLDLAQYQPDVLISSLVTSQLYGLAHQAFVELAFKQAWQLCNSKEGTMDKACMNRLLPPLQEFHRKNAAIIERTYYKGILGAQASWVYFSDTYTQDGLGIDQKELQSFLNAMQEKYTFEFGASAWEFPCAMGNMPVTWYRFRKK
ncbi:MAG TPA: hypothetical protein VEL47_00480 [Myxococcota bacterium]|nr:hypothetical protein [Myxococcota bacterium]